MCGGNLQDRDKVRPAAVLDALPGLGKTTAALAFGRWFHREQAEMHGPQVPAGDGTWQRIPVACLGLTCIHDAEPEPDAPPVTFLFVGVGLRACGLLDEGLAGADAAFSQTARRWNMLPLGPFEIRTQWAAAAKLRGVAGPGRLRARPAGSRIRRCGIRR